MNRTSSRKDKQTALLVALAVGMFGFAFALVPLYEVFCELTGLNGKTGGQVTVVEVTGSVSEREVTVEFLGRVGRGLPWEFRPTEHRLSVRPGEIHTTTYFVRNRAGQPVTGQATPSVTPGRAAQYLKKIECFCFTNQELEAGEEVEMPVRFLVAEDLPEDVTTLSLSYTFFKVREGAPQQLASIGDEGV